MPGMGATGIHLDFIEENVAAEEGYEGGLLTSADKFNGTILYNRASPQARRRFTIGHELGHFLMPSHLPSADGRFLCKMQDMLALKRRRGRQAPAHGVEAAAQRLRRRI